MKERSAREIYKEAFKESQRRDLQARMGEEQSRKVLPFIKRNEGRKER